MSSLLKIIQNRRIMKALKFKNNQDYWEAVEHNRFGLLPILLTVQSCLGSIAVCYISGLEDQIQVVLLSVVAGVTMGANGAAIAQAPMKWVMLGFFLCLITSSIALTIALIIR